MAEVYEGKPYVPPSPNQIVAPAYISRLMPCLRTNMLCYGHTWRADSFDIQLFDYNVWSVIERKCGFAPSSIELQREHLRQVCERFRTRIEAVITMNCVLILTERSTHE